MIIRRSLFVSAVLAAACAARVPAAGPIAPADQHKVLVEDPAMAAVLAASGASTIADYGAFRLMSASAQQTAIIPPGSGVQVRDDFDSILLNSFTLRTRGANASVAAVPPAFAGRRLFLAQFQGPVLPEWYESLRSSGARIVCYIPNNAYLVYADAAQAGSASAAAGMQWMGEYRSPWKVARSVQKALTAKGKAASHGVSLQLVQDEAANPATLAAISALSTRPIRTTESLGYVNVVAEVPLRRLPEITARPDVVSVQPWSEPHKMDERQAIISAGKLTGNAPSGPGYLAWLTGLGFTQAQFDASGMVVDLSDSGVDNGTVNPYHPGLHAGGVTASVSHVAYARLEGTAGDSSTLKGCDGHGTENAHIIAGYNNLTGSPWADAAGYRYGLGIAPFVRVGSSVIFDPNYTYPDPVNLQARAYRDGARISSNSWGHDAAGAYDSMCQAYDALVRDAQPSKSAVDTAGNQPMVIVFSAGNAGPDRYTMGSPGGAKNLISVGASENVQAFGGPDGCQTGDDEANSANDIVGFSSRGPCTDGRVKPDLVAPGTHVSGGVVQTATPGATGTADACFDASGVCGGRGSNFFPSGQQFYTASSGTSHSCPAVAGGAALIRQWFLNRGLPAPSPAMTKAVLLNSARYLNGTDAADTLPSNKQGMGAMNLGDAFASIPRILQDQVSADILTAAGQRRVFTGVVADTSKPFRVTLAWTDAPGSTAGAAFTNDLDLQVVVGGQTYLGNVFQGATSVAGGLADHRNNVESVVLPAGTSGTFAVVIVAKNIVADGIPGNGVALDQDFAMVATNASEQAAAVIAPGSATITSESCAPGNLAVDPAETVDVALTLTNIGTAASTATSATLKAQGGVTPITATQSYGTLAAGASVARTFRFTAQGAPGDTILPTLAITSGGSSLGSAPFPMRLGVGGPAGPVSFAREVPTVSDDNGTITQTINVPDGGVVDSVKVALRMDHPYAADAILSLTGPDGTRVLLSAGAGAPGAGFGAGTNDSSASFCVFDDTASTSIAGVVAPAVGPVQPIEPLAAFAGKPIAGLWTLTMENTYAGETATLHAWRLDFTKRVYRSCTTVTPGEAVANGVTLAAETCANGVIDPAELVTLDLGLRNIGGSTMRGVTATLLPTDGVIPATAAQTYGDIAQDASASKPFQLYLRPGCWGVNTVTLRVSENGVTRGDVPFSVHRGKLSNAATQASYPGLGTPAAIPDADVLVRSVTLPDNGIISHMKVNIRLNHTWVSDIYITLTSPDGTTALLVDGVGGSGQNLGSGNNSCSGVFTVLDDAASVSIDEGTAPFAGTYRPTQSLSAFNGKPIAGKWTLAVYDIYSADTGTLGCWSIEATTLPTDCCGASLSSTPARITAETCTPPNGAVDANEVVTVALPLVNTGNRATSNLVATLLPQSGIVPVSPTATYGAVGANSTVEKTFRFVADASCGSTVNASFRLSDGLADLGTVTQPFFVGVKGSPVSKTYTYAGAATTIPDRSSITSTINVPDAGMVNSLTVKVRLNHTYISDLFIGLISPDGTGVVLFAEEGGDGQNLGTGANTCAGVGTIFDDASIYSIASGTAPFSGAFRPEEPLSGFAGHSLQGAWQLYIEDGYGGDTGVLGCWSITPNYTPVTCCTSAGYTMVDVLNAARTFGGLPNTGSFTRLNVVTSGASASRVDAQDVVRLARKVAGLESNP